MREYEVVYIFHPSLETEDVDGKLEAYHERLDGEITAVEHWGQRQLAYEIQDERKGYYVVAQFRADPSSLSAFEQALRLDEQLMRHLIVLSEGELPTPPSRRREEEKEREKEAKAERAGADEDEGDDGDENHGDEEDEDEQGESGDEADDEDDEDADEDEASDDEEK